MESVREILAQSGIGCLRIMLSLQSSFIDANELFSFAGFLAETIVGDPIQPGRKTRFPAKAAEVFIGPQKGLLREIVRERNIGANQLPEQTPNARLMIPDQLPKGVVVILKKNASDEICIG